MKFTFIDTPTREETKIFLDGLVRHNSNYLPNDFEKHFIVVKSDSGDVVGGIKFETYWGRSFIHTLWIEESYRNCGLGTELLKRTEEITKSVNCHGVDVSTMNFQAKELYEKNGFKCTGKFENYTNGHECFFYSKEI